MITLHLTEEEAMEVALLIQAKLKNDPVKEELLRLSAIIDQLAKIKSNARGKYKKRIKEKRVLPESEKVVTIYSNQKSLYP